MKEIKKMKKNYISPKMEAITFNVLDIITVSALDMLGSITPSEGGNDPAMEEIIG